MKLRCLAHFICCLAIGLAGCSREPDSILEASSQGNETEKTVDAKPVSQAVPKTALDESLLFGVWSLQAVSADNTKAPAGVTVEFQMDGTLISRENSKVVSKGMFSIEGNRLTVITPGDENAGETREIAAVSKLTAQELELTNEKAVMRFTRR